MKNIKLNKYKIEGVTWDNDILKCEIILANNRADAIAIFTDKHYKLTNTKALNIRVSYFLN